AAAPPPAAAAPTGPLTAALGCSTPALPPTVSGAVLTSAATVTAANGGTYCRVAGNITPQGPAATSNQVRFMVAMPSTFQSRYFFVGEGGSAGFIPNPSESLLASGYVVAGSDAGSTTPGVNWLFANDRTKAFDYAQRGAHVSTEATQTLARAYYGMTGSSANASRKMYRYIDGCSGGGRMGIVAASVYPNDFDGVVAGAPGISVSNQMFFGKVIKHLLDNPAS
ncbi:MAG: hypothetical protein CFE45_38215, partial [Burkholderiales bacterium PBB5]